MAPDMAGRGFGQHRRKKKRICNGSWVSLGLLFRSPPGAAPLRQSRCSVKAKSSSNEILVAWVTRPERKKNPDIGLSRRKT